MGGGGGKTFGTGVCKASAGVAAGGGGGGGRGGLITSALGGKAFSAAANAEHMRGKAGGLSITGGKPVGILVGAALPTSSNASMPVGAACIRPPPVGIRSPKS